MVRYITDDLKLFPHDSNENNFPLINAEKKSLSTIFILFFSSSRRDLACNTNQSLQIKILTGKILATVENSHNKRRLFHQAKTTAIGNSRKRRKIKKKRYSYTKSLVLFIKQIYIFSANFLYHPKVILTIIGR